MPGHKEEQLRLLLKEHRALLLTRGSLGKALEEEQKRLQFLEEIESKLSALEIDSMAKRLLAFEGVSCTEGEFVTELLTKGTDLESVSLPDHLNSPSVSCSINESLCFLMKSVPTGHDHRLYKSMQSSIVSAFKNTDLEPEFQGYSELLERVSASIQEFCSSIERLHFLIDSLNEAEVEAVQISFTISNEIPIALRPSSIRQQQPRSNALFSFDNSTFQTILESVERIRFKEKPSFDFYSIIASDLTNRIEETKKFLSGPVNSFYNELDQFYAKVSELS